jgi:hypothetical protein
MREIGTEKAGVGLTLIAGRSAQRNRHADRKLQYRGQWIVGSEVLPQHFLNFLPEPQGHRSLRPTFVDRRSRSRCGSGRSGSRQ